jgi:hypothetical protein
MWAAGAIRFGYKWLVGDGKSIKFWEDTWYGNAPLAVIYWDILHDSQPTGSNYL